jgi:hypothetical protein
MSTIHVDATATTATTSATGLAAQVGVLRTQCFVQITSPTRRRIVHQTSWWSSRLDRIRLYSRNSLRCSSLAGLGRVEAGLSSGTCRCRGDATRSRKSTFARVRAQGPVLL